MKETIEKTTNTAEVIEQTQNEKPYTFRKLSTSDIFPTLRLLNKLGLKQMREDESVKRIVAQLSSASSRGKVDPMALGLDMFFEITCLVVDNLPKCEMEVYDLLSRTSNLSAEEIQAQDMAVTFEMITDFIRKEEFGDFFKAVSKLFK